MGLANYEEQKANLQRLSNAIRAIHECRQAIGRGIEQVRAAWAPNRDSNAVINLLGDLQGCRIETLSRVSANFHADASYVLEQMNGLERIFQTMPIGPAAPFLEFADSAGQPRISMDTMRLKGVADALNATRLRFSAAKTDFHTNGRRIDALILQQKNLQVRLTSICRSMDNVETIYNQIIEMTRAAAQRYEDAERRIRQKADALPALRFTGWLSVQIGPITKPVVFPGPGPNLIQFISSFEDSAE